MKILIVKASSLGDILQTLHAISYLRSRKDVTSISWAIDQSYKDFITSLEMIDQAYMFDFKKLKKIYLLKNLFSFLKFIKKLRKTKYDVVFDLQGNIKSAIITFFVKSKIKVGFSKKCAREKFNTLATNIHIDVDKSKNIREQYLSVVKKYFSDNSSVKIESYIKLKLNDLEKNKVEKILNDNRLNSKQKIMVCPGSRWDNKMLSTDTFKYFLKLIDKNENVSFLFVWGNQREKEISLILNQEFINNSILVDKINIPTWHYLMTKMDLVIAKDSSSLHLSSIANVKTYGIFGPTLADILKPIGANHIVYQGKCPYNLKFMQFCPKLRTCITGSCIKDIKAEDLYNNLIHFFKKNLNYLKKDL
jgi:heptosyltransferase-1